MTTAHIELLDGPLLRALLALLEHKNVSRAARSLGVTQSALSHTLARLRVLLDDPLFVRTQHGMLPTPRALELEAPLRTATAALEQILRPSGPVEPSTLRRTFSISTADFGELIAVPPLLARLELLAPGVQVRVRPATEELEAPLESGELDVALGVFGSLPPRLMQRRVLRERFVCVLRADHPVLREGLTPERFAALRHVLIAPRGTGGGSVDAALGRLGLRREIAARVFGFLAAPLMVERSDLVITVPGRVAAVMCVGRALTVVEPPLEVPDFEVTMVWHERFQTDPVHRWLRDVLVASVAPG